MKKNWYYNLDLKPQGPISLEEMRNLIRGGDVRPYDLISQEDEGSWKPACEWSVFERTLFPATQEFIPGQDFSNENKEWVLLVNEEGGKNVLQEGPYSRSELIQNLNKKVVNNQQYVWKAGLSGWCRIADRPEFQNI